MVEVDQWVQESVCRHFKGVIPQGRVMKMRWVLTLKATDNPKVAKSKARIVLLGYTDPDLTTLATSAPTFTRRSRQLTLNLAAAKHWTLTKADAKSAFLQGTMNRPTGASMPFPYRSPWCSSWRMCPDPEGRLWTSLSAP